MQMLITGMQTLKRKVLFRHSTNIYCAVKPLAAGDIAVKRKRKQILLLFSGSFSLMRRRETTNK